MSLRSEFHVVMSDTICPSIRYSVRLYLQLFVGKHMSYLHYLCLFAHSGVQHIMFCVFLRFVYPMLPVSLDCPFSNVYLHTDQKRMQNSISDGLGISPYVCVIADLMWILQ